MLFKRLTATMTSSTQALGLRRFYLAIETTTFAEDGDHRVSVHLAGNNFLCDFHYLPLVFCARNKFLRMERIFGSPSCGPGKLYQIDERSSFYGEFN